MHTLVHPHAQGQEGDASDLALQLCSKEMVEAADGRAELAEKEVRKEMCANRARVCMLVQGVRLSVGSSWRVRMAL